MSASSSRRVLITDRLGVETEEDVSTEHVARLLDELTPDDEEHASVSITDSDGWYLDYDLDLVAFGNVEPGEDSTLALRGLPRDERLRLAAEFIDNDFEALRRRAWETL